MQKIPSKAVPPGAALKPPVYKPVPAPAVLQAKPAPPSLAQVQVKVPPVFHPARQPLLQAKLAPVALPPGQLIQRMEPQTNNKKQQKIKDAQKAKKRNEQRQEDKTRRNARGYGGFTDTKLINDFIDNGGVIRGHLSDDSNSKASGHTTSGLDDLRDFKASQRAEGSRAENDDDAYRAPKEKKPIAQATKEELESGAINAWNLAVSANKNGLTAMREYLQKRRQFNVGVTTEMVNDILDVWTEYNPDEELPV